MKKGRPKFLVPEENLIALGRDTSPMMRQRQSSLPHHQSSATSSHHSPHHSLVPSSFISSFQTVDDCEDVVNEIINLVTNSDDLERRESILLTSIDILLQKTKSPAQERYHYISLVYIAKKYPQAFDTENIKNKLTHILFSQVYSTLPPKKNSIICLFAINVLMKLYKAQLEWPPDFVKAFISDGLGERIWVDHEYAKDFVEGICTGLRDVDTPMENTVCRYNQANILIDLRQVAITEVNRHISKADVKNVIKFLGSCLRISNLRLLVSRYMDTWLSHPTFSRIAKDLLQGLAMNIKDSSEEDMIALQALMNVKVKQGINNQYFDFISQVIKNNSIYPNIALRNILHMEIQRSSHTPQNMKLFVLIFKSIPEGKENYLGYVLQEMILTDEYQPIIRSLLKRIIKTLLPEGLDIGLLCNALMTEGVSNTELSSELKKRWIDNLMDLICLTCVSAAMYQPKDVHDEKEFRFKLSSIQANYMEWCKSFIPIYLSEVLTTQYFVDVIKKGLFLFPIDEYLLPSENPTENEKNLFRYWLLDTPLEESTLITLIYVTLQMKLLPQDTALDVIYNLLCRAASSKLKLITKGIDMNTIKVSNIDVIVAIFRMTVYLPELPEGAMLPDQTMSICVKNWFWKAVLITLIITTYCANNVREVWDLKCIRYLLEKIIKNTSSQISQQEEDPNFASKERECIITFGDSMMLINEKYNLQIEVFESRQVERWIIDFTVNELNEIRIPPKEILMTLEILMDELKLGSILRSCRDPDFLTMIMNHEGNEQSLHWLYNIVQHELSTLTVLPTQILCNLLVFTLLHNAEAEEHQKSQVLLGQVVIRLAHLLFRTNKQTSYDVMIFFIRMLASDKISDRNIAQDSLSRLLKQPDAGMEPYDQNISYGVTNPKFKWLEQLQNLECWKDIKDTLWDAFNHMIMFHTDVEFISALIELLYASYIRNALEIALSLSILLTSRPYLSEQIYDFNRKNSLMIHLLTQKIFVEALNYLKKIQTMLSSSDDKTGIVEINCSNQQILLPKLFIEGFIKFISQKKTNTGNIFTDSTQQMIELFFSASDGICSLRELESLNSTPNPLFTTEVAKLFLVTNNPFLIQKALNVLSLNDLLDILGTFGKTQECYELTYQKLETSFSEENIYTSLLFFKEQSTHLFDRIIEHFKISNFNHLKEKYPNLCRVINKVNTMETSSETKKMDIEDDIHIERQKRQEEDEMLKNSKFWEDYIRGKKNISSFSSMGTNFTKMLNDTLKQLSKKYYIDEQQKDILVCIMKSFDNLLDTTSLTKNSSFIFLIISYFNLMTQLMNKINDEQWKMEIICNVEPLVLKLCNFNPIIVPYIICSRFMNNATVLLKMKYLEKIDQFNNILMDMKLLKEEEMIDTSIFLVKRLLDTKDMMEDSNQYEGERIIYYLADEDTKAEIIVSILYDILSSSTKSVENIKVLENLVQSLLSSHEYMSKRMKNNEINFNGNFLKCKSLSSIKQVQNATKYNGILLDMVSYLDPSICMIKSLKKLIFGLSSSTDIDIVHRTRLVTFLMTLLLENNSPSSLQVILNDLMQNVNIPSMDAVSSLQFIQSLWGKSAIFSGHRIVSCYFDATEEFAKDIALLVWKELEQVMKNETQIYKKKQFKNNAMKLLQSDERYAEHVNMLMNIMSTSNKNLKSVVHYFCDMFKTENGNKTLKQLMKWIYCSFPTMTSLLYKRYEVYELIIDEEQNYWNSKTDSLLHRICHSLVVSNKPEISMFAFSMCVQLATLYPALVTRYLASICSPLESNPSMTAYEYVSKGLLRIYLQVLGILDALGPYIFKVSEKQLDCVNIATSEGFHHCILHPILEKYLTFLQCITFYDTKFSGLISKLVNFLIQYMLHNSNVNVFVCQKQKHLTKFIPVFERLKVIYVEITEDIECLLHFIQADENSENFNTIEKKLELKMLSSQEKNLNICQQLQLRYLEYTSWIEKDLQYQSSHSVYTLDSSSINSRKLSPNKNVVNIMLKMQNLKALLEEIKQKSQHCPDMLTPLTPCLLELCKVRNDESVRNCSFQLLLKCLENDPKTYNKIIPSYLELIDYPFCRSIQHHAARYASEFFVYSSEYSELLLMKLFQQGTTQSLESLDRIFQIYVNV